MIVPTLIKTYNKHGSVRELNADQLLSIARRRSKLDDFGDMRFLDGLKALVDSANHDARLTPFGSWVMRLTITRQLVNRLIWVQGQSTQKQFFETPLHAPLIVTGQPRSGTTLLHRLLSLDPNHRGVAAYEVFYPFAWQPKKLRRRRAQFSLALLSAASPDLVKKHAMFADTPEEDTAVMAQSFLSYAWWGFGPFYGYIDWLMSQDEARAYQEYASFLPLFQSLDLDRRLVLKSPVHTPNTDLLRKYIPNAMIVQTHRDPVDVIPSMTSLALSLHTKTAEVNAAETARFHIKMQSEVMRRNLANKAADPGSVQDVFYPDLLRDPHLVVRSIYERYHLDWPNDLDQKISDYLTENRQGKHGAHHYAASDFGITDSEIKKAFSDYLSTYRDQLSH
ncbi:sulfotransferase family protein [Hyphococcus sp. DH-69]|uniref:sulfotransferase family protein n=1 Tax=Hyphococcus formosus TaxID=3143534 RepID=UPI00398AFB3F